MIESNKIEIEVDTKEATKKHIQDLQDIITRKNKEIEELKEKLHRYENDPVGLITGAHRQGVTEGSLYTIRTITRDLKDILERLNTQENILNDYSPIMDRGA